MPATKSKPAKGKKHLPPCRLKPRKPDPLTTHMLQTLKKIQGGKTPAFKGATTPEEGAKQGAMAYTLKNLARRGLIRFDGEAKPKLLPAGLKAIQAVYGG